MWLAPSYEQKAFPADERKDRLRLVASRDARDGSVTVHQDADVFVATLSPGTTITHRLGEGRAAWVQAVRGRLDAGGTRLSEGDGLAVEKESGVTLKALDESELILFDLK